MLPVKSKQINTSPMAGEAPTGRWSNLWAQYLQISEARLVGKTNDGGVDLILLESDAPILVQVKRRKRAEKTEGVVVIRDAQSAM